MTLFFVFVWIMNFCDTIFKLRFLIIAGVFCYHVLCNNCGFIVCATGFSQECRKITICYETPSEMINEDKGDTRNAGNVRPEGNKWGTGNKGMKGEKWSQGEFCTVGASTANNKIAGSLDIAAAK